MIGCWLLVFGCRLVATILPTTKYQQPITLNFFFVFYIDILFSKQQNNKTTRQPLLYIDIESACSDAFLIIYGAERELIMRIAECVTIDAIGRSLCFL